MLILVMLNNILGEEREEGNNCARIFNNDLVQGVIILKGGLDCGFSCLRLRLLSLVGASIGTTRAFLLIV